MRVPWAGVGPEIMVKLAIVPSISVPANGTATAAPSSVGAAVVAGVAIGTLARSVVTGTLTVPLTGVVPSVTVTATGGKSPPAFTKAAPAAVSVTTPVVGLMA